MPDKITTPAESIGTKLKKWVIGAATAAAVIAGGYAIGDWSDTKGYPVYDKMSQDTIWCADSMRLVFVADSLAKVRLSTSFKIESGQLVCTRGETEIKSVDVDGKLESVTVAKYVAVRQDVTDDSVSIVYKPQKSADGIEWDIVPDWDQIKDDTYRHEGKIEPTLAYRFKAGKLYNPAIREYAEVADLVIDKKAGTYSGTIPRDWIWDPEYVAAPGLIGLTINGTRPASYDTVGLAHDWLMNDTNASGITPDSGNATAVNGQLKNGVTLSTGYFSGTKACSLDGTNDTIVFSALPQFDSTNAFTLSFRMKLKSVASSAIMGLTYAASENFYIKMASDTTIEWRITTNSSAGVAWVKVNNAINNWHSFTILYDGTQSTNATKMRLYIDGVLQTLSFSGTIPTTTNNMSTTKWYFGSIMLSSLIPINGLIDNVKLHSASKSVITANTYAVSGRERHRLDSTTTGLFTIDTAGARVDVIRIAVTDTTVWRYYPVEADGVYDLSPWLTNNALNTIFVGDTNNVGYGGVTAYSVYADMWSFDTTYRDTAISKNLYLNPKQRHRRWSDSLQVDSITTAGDTTENWKVVYRDTLYYDTVNVLADDRRRR